MVFNWPKSGPVYPRSSSHSPAVRCSSLASQKCQCFSWTSPYDRMRTLICLSSQHCYIDAQQLSSYHGSALISPFGLCSYARVQRNQHFSARAQSNRHFSAMVQSSPNFPSRHSEGMVTSLLCVRTSWGVEDILGRAPSHSASLPWAIKVHISLCKAPIVAYHETNQLLHQQFPADWRKEIKFKKYSCIHGVLCNTCFKLKLTSIHSFTLSTCKCSSKHN